VSSAETLAELVDRIPDEVPAILKMNVSDPGRLRRPRGDEHEFQDL
jgi:hypothetical protein